MKMFTVWLWVFGLACCGAAWGEEELLSWDSGDTLGGTELFSTNSTAGVFFFKVTTELTDESVGYWRSVLTVSHGEADLFLKKGARPSMVDFDYSSSDVGCDEVVLELTEGEEWFLTVVASEGAQWSLFAGDMYVDTLTWDGGDQELGTEVFNGVSAAGELRFFKLVTENADLGMWRTVLNVQSGEASLYLRQDVLPSANDAFDYSSKLTGDDGIAMPLSDTDGHGEVWYILVEAETDSAWSLFSGDVFVTDLGTLAADASSGSGVSTIPAEGVRYFKTTIPVDAMAWRLWLQDASATTSLDELVAVRKGLAPSLTVAMANDQVHPGQMLLVPDYLEAGGSTPYYVGVGGEPGSSFLLDSRQHVAETIDFNGEVTASVTGFHYKTYRIDVPPDLIAWELTLTPLDSSNPDMAINLSQIPNAYNNIAFSELDSTTLSESVTLVPPFLSSGAHYVTLYSDVDYSFSLKNSPPEVTLIDYIGVTENDDVNRAGWRYYAVTDIDQQLGHLGWLLELTNQVENSEIAIRRNNVPSRWSYRAGGVRNLAYSTKSSTCGSLQDPAHEADIWYIGVYSPTDALGAFELTGSSLLAEDIEMDGSVRQATSLAPNSWDFFHVTVPATLNGEEIKGWELRIADWARGKPSIVVRRDMVPYQVKTSGRWGDGSSPHTGDGWDSLSAWASTGKDWSLYKTDAGSSKSDPQPIISMAWGRPLEPGGYYIGIYNNSSVDTCSYTLESRAIGMGMGYEIGSLNYDGGDVTCSGLNVRGVAYFEIDVPTNQPNWKIHVENVTGESMLYLRRGYVPTWGQTGTGYESPGEQNDENLSKLTRLQKSGDEFFVLFPENIYDDKPKGELPVLVPPGKYYMMLVSEGVAPEGSEAGTGVSSAILHSEGVIEPLQLGVLNLDNELEYHGVYRAGEINYLQFEMGTASWWYTLQVNNASGEPDAKGLWRVVPDNLAGYGARYGGMYSGYGYDDRLDIPCSSTYNVMVSDPRPAAAIEAGEYDLTIFSVTNTAIAFDGGGDTVTGLVGRVVYKVEAPPLTSGVEGWELRLTEWAGVRPVMTVCQGRYPRLYALGQNLRWDWATGKTKSWKPAQVLPSGAFCEPWEYFAQWAVSSGDWSGYDYSSDGKQQHPQYVMSSGVDRPFLPGETYYICFESSSCSGDCNFTFESRGIGPSFSYDPVSIPFDGGSAVITNLLARDVAYFKIEVPDGVPSWKVQLANTAGESALYIRKDSLPTIGQSAKGYFSPGLSSYKDLGNVTYLDKLGDEFFVLLPEGTNDAVTAGTYYLMVASQGEDPAGRNIGSGSSSAELHSLGVQDVLDLGALQETGEITYAGEFVAGEITLCHFTVPAGVSGMEVRLVATAGAPEMNLAEGSIFADWDKGSSSRYGGLYSGFKSTNEVVQSADVITVADPQEGVWSLLIGDPGTAALLADGSYELSILTLSTEPVAFNGGSITLTNLEPNTWAFYNVEVPEAGEPNGDYLGWELRVNDWYGEKPPIMAVRRSSLPDGTKTHKDDGSTWRPVSAESWPEKYQWATKSSPVDWTKYTYESGHVDRYSEFLLSMGRERPLVPGSYIIGFFNSSLTTTGGLSCASSVIGPSGSYPVQPIDFDGGSATITNLRARGVAYFSVEVPEDTPSWKVQLENTAGESMLYIRKDAVPTLGQTGSSTYSPAAQVNQVVKLQKLGDEHYSLFPIKDMDVIPAGTYYLMVVSEGVGPVSFDIGSGSSGAVLHSLGVDEVTYLGDVSDGIELSAQVAYEGGDIDLYCFSISNTIAAVELQLSNSSGTPKLNMISGSMIPMIKSTGYGGMFSGYASDYVGTHLVTMPNVSTGMWSLVIGDPDVAARVSAGSCDLTIVELLPLDLSVDVSSATNGCSSSFSGSLADGQRTYFKVEVPELFNESPIVGWSLVADSNQGSAGIRARLGALPEDDNKEQTGWGEGALMVAPPMLTAGTWYVEVMGDGATSYTLTSTLVEPLQNWVMPTVGQPVTTPGLVAPLFGDSGVSTNGVPLPGDQGVTLARDCYHVYAVTVPENNAGLLSTRLEAISGNPDLYIRLGSVPTLNHDTDSSGHLYDHLLDSDDFTQYGNWVPADGRNETEFTSGTWYLMVKAEGDSDARYRLKIFGGNIYEGSSVQNLVLDGGVDTDRLLAKGDWCYYCVDIPDPLPETWRFGFTINSGDVDLFLRDSVLPGNSGKFSDKESGIIDWREDDKVAGEEAWYPDEGMQTLDYSMLLPGKTYYLGFIGKEDSSFDVRSELLGGSWMPDYPVIDFYNGSVVTNLPAGASLTYRINVPDEAVRWMHSSTVDSSVFVYIKQGSLASSVSGGYDYKKSGTGELNRSLLNNEWPWLTGESYYMTVTNSSATDQSFSFYMQGSLDIERPTRVTAGDGADDAAVRIGWVGVSGVSDYDVWRSDSPDTNTAIRIVEGLRNISFYDADAVPGVTNYYWVAIAGAASSDWWSLPDGGWLSATGAVAPSQLHFTAAGGQEAVTVDIADGVLWGGYEKESWLSIPQESVGAGNGSLDVTVVLYSGAENRTGTVMVAGCPVTVVQDAFGVPQNVQASDGLYSNKVEVVWDHMPLAASYEVYRGLSDDRQYASRVMTVSTNEYVDEDVLFDVVYYYWIKGRNDAGRGGDSELDTGSLINPEKNNWLALHFPDGYPGDSADPDLDGFSNIEEYIAQSDPTNALSFFNPGFLGVDEGGSMAIEIIHSAIGRVYNIQWCENLNDGEWTDVEPRRPGNGDTLILQFYDDKKYLMIRTKVRMQ